MTLDEMQEAIMLNKQRRNFNITDTGKEIIHIVEELGELASSYRDRNIEGINDAIGDIMVYCIGLCAIRGISSQTLLTRIISRNTLRNYRNEGL